MPEKKSDKASTFIGGLLLAILSCAGIAVLYLGRHHKGPLQHVDLSGDATQFYAGLGAGVLLGVVFMFWKPKSPAQPEPQVEPQVQAPPQGQQPPSQYPQQWTQPQQGQYPQYPPQQPPSQYPQQPPYDPNRPS